MILYHDDLLIEYYEEYKTTMPAGTATLDIEQYRVRIFEPLLEEIHNDRQV
jgi:phage terminase Nu1 subunit (DNA packaging protein)